MLHKHTVNVNVCIKDSILAVGEYKTHVQTNIPFVRDKESGARSCLATLATLVSGKTLVGKEVSRTLYKCFVLYFVSLPSDHEPDMANSGMFWCIVLCLLYKNININVMIFCLMSSLNKVVSC